MSYGTLNNNLMHLYSNNPVFMVKQLQLIKKQYACYSVMLLQNELIDKLSNMFLSIFSLATTL